MMAFRQSHEADEIPDELTLCKYRAENQTLKYQPYSPSEASCGVKNSHSE